MKVPPACSVARLLCYTVRTAPRPKGAGMGTLQAFGALRAELWLDRSVAAAARKRKL